MELGPAPASVCSLDLAPSRCYGPYLERKQPAIHWIAGCFRTKKNADACKSCRAPVAWRAQYS